MATTLNAVYFEIRRGPSPPEATGVPACFRVVEGDIVRIGSKPGLAHVVFDDCTVARLHTAVRLRDGKCEVRDLGSHCGTRVNGRQVNQWRALEAGDTVEIGQVTLVFHPERPDDRVTTAEHWIERLRTEGPGATWPFALDRIGPERAAQAFTASLLDESPAVSRHSAVALGRLGPEAAAAVPALVERLESDGAPEVRRAAAFALGAIGPLAAPAVPVLVRLLRPAQGEANDPFLLAEGLSLRDEVARALGRIGPAAVEALPALAEAARTDGFTVAGLAREAIERIRSGAATT